MASSRSDGSGPSPGPGQGMPLKKSKKSKNSLPLSTQHDETGSAASPASGGYTPAQAAMNDMMRKALETDEYSALGSVVDTDSSDDDDDGLLLPASAGAGASSSSRRGGGSLLGREPGSSSGTRLDRSVILSAMRKHLRLEGMRGSVGNVIETGGPAGWSGTSGDPDDTGHSGGLRGPSPVLSLLDAGKDVVRGGLRKKKKKKGRKTGRGRDDADCSTMDDDMDMNDAESAVDIGADADDDGDDDYQVGEDESSIFGQTTGASNATWVECDKCKKVSWTSSFKHMEVCQSSI